MEKIECGVAAGCRCRLRYMLTISTASNNTRLHN